METLPLFVPDGQLTVAVGNASGTTPLASPTENDPINFPRKIKSAMDGGFDLAENAVGRTPAWELEERCKKNWAKLRRIQGESGCPPGQSIKPAKFQSHPAGLIPERQIILPGESSLMRNQMQRESLRSHDSLLLPRLILILLVGRSLLSGLTDPLLSQVAAPTEGPVIQYRDIAPQSNFSYISNNDFSGRKYFPQPMCGGIAVLDFDHDGKMDLFFTNGAKLPDLKKSSSTYYNCLLRNKGDGTFEDVTEKAGLSGADIDFCFGVAAGDFDNDGWTDLFICCAGRNALYHNNGNGTFSDVTVAAGLADKPKDLLSVCAAFFDYDNDGLVDLVVSQYTYWNPLTDVRCVRDGTTDSYCHPRTYKSVPHTLYHNLGNGKFENVTVKSGFSAALGKGMGVGIADFNGDGWQDVFVANDTERNFLYVNQKNGTFKEVGLLYGVAYNDDGITVSGMGCDAKDFNNDGWVDVFYNNLQGQIFALFQNEAGELFRYVSPGSGVEALSRRFSGWSNGFVDYNNDGWKDIYSSNGDVDYFEPNARQHDTMFENLDGKRFVEVSGKLGKDYLRMGFQRGSAFADLNNDGFQDIVVTSLNEKPRILMNSAGNGNHWLLVDLTGRKSNRDAIGAKIKVTLASGRLLYGHVSASVGFMSSSDRRVHFGLGKETDIKSVEIRWPLGATQTVSTVKSDQVLAVTEPASSTSP
jgi:enediyne biosynthesis protein E4